MKTGMSAMYFVLQVLIFVVPALYNFGTAATVHTTNLEKYMGQMDLGKTTRRYLIKYNCKFGELPDKQRYAAPRVTGLFHCFNTEPTSFGAVVCSKKCRLPNKSRRTTRNHVQPLFSTVRLKPRSGKKMKAVKVPTACECLWRKNRRRSRKRA